MRILFLNYEYPPLGGGAANATKFLIDELGSLEETTIDLVTSSTSKDRVESVSDSVKIHYLDIGKSQNLHLQSNAELATYSIRSYFYARRLMGIHQYDLVHAFFGIPCGLVALLLGAPYVVSLRGSDVPGFSERFGLLDKLAFESLSKTVWSKAEAVVANSKGLRELARETSESERISVIPNGVSTEFFYPAEEKTPSLSIRLISTGRLIRRKGYEHLIRALAGQSRFHLTLVGDGDLKKSLETLAKDLGVSLEFVGRRQRGEVRRFLQGSDVFVLPSRNEGMSNSLLEAMACGLPVVVTDAPGSVELVDGNGIVVPKENPNALRDALLWYRDNPGTMASHGVISRRRALAMGWASVASKYFEIYENVLDSRRR